MTMNILQSINWFQAAPLLAVIGGLCTFILYKRRQWSLEIEKLELEIARMRREESLIYRPTIDEMRRVFEGTRSFERIGSLVGDDLSRFGADLRHYLVSLRLYYNDPQMKQEADAQPEMHKRYRMPETYPRGRPPDPKAILEKWSAIRDNARKRLPGEVFEEVDSLLRYLAKGDIVSSANEQGA